jgi:hypothetical protein
VIPEGQRDSRTTLVAAANAYLGKEVPEDSCQVGVPSGVNIRRGASSSTRRLERLLRFAPSVSADCRIRTSFG